MYKNTGNHGNHGNILKLLFWKRSCQVAMPWDNRALAIGTAFIAHLAYNIFIAYRYLNQHC